MILLPGGSDYRVGEEQGKGEGVIYLTPEQEKQIKKLMERTVCPFDFRCKKSEFCDLKKRVQNIGLPDFLECIENAQALCSYQISYGSRHYCTCPLAAYAVKNRLWNWNGKWWYYKIMLTTILIMLIVTAGAWIWLYFTVRDLRGWPGKKRSNKSKADLSKIR